MLARSPVEGSRHLRRRLRFEVSSLQFRVAEALASPHLYLGGCRAAIEERGVIGSSGRHRSLRGVGWLGAILLRLVTGCGAAADVRAEGSSAAVDIETLVRQLPETALSAMAVDR